MTVEHPSIYPPPPDFVARSRVGSRALRDELVARADADPQAFWASVARRLEWMRPFSRVENHDFAAARIRWFEDGTLNASVNCLDRWVRSGRGETTAIIWEGDDPANDARLTYAELLSRVERLGNVLRKHGVGRGDRVCIYLPMIPELAIAVLACARIGAIHSVVFGGFSADSLRDRILDSSCRLVITADEGIRGGKVIPLKATTDAALVGVDCVEKVLVVRRTGAAVARRPEIDLDYRVEIEAADVQGPCAPEEMSAEDPLFILYTSGSTGKPKGVLHTTGGYLVYAAYTHELVFDLRDDDIYWCTADIGWITGHSYIVYGPLANGATTLLFEGIPTFPDPGRFWDVVDKHAVTTFYTAPTAIRSIMRAGDAPVRSRSRRTLRLLGTVGEPINPEVWVWYHDVCGDGRCPIVDTWWQTETGGILIAPLPGAVDQKPGSATLPLPGISPVLVDDDGRALEGMGVAGNLCVERPWPGIMRTVWGDHQRFFDTYFKRFPGRYFTGDGCRRDEDGYYWITGRVDDVINVAGHRLGTAEVESALVAHDAVTEAAVVGMPHEIKGQGIYAFVTLLSSVQGDDDLRRELIATVRQIIGPIATPDRIQFAPALPKTRSGKIMRRILRGIASGSFDGFGDISTLADPTVVEDLVREARRP